MLLQSKIRKKGFTLIEALFAVFIIGVGLMAIILAITQILNLSSYSASKLTAAYLAQEGIEIVRNVRDTNWLQARFIPVPYDDGLSQNCFSGCIADYRHSYGPDQLNPVLPPFTNQFLKIDANGFYNYTVGTPTKFQRIITMTQPSSDERNVTVEVRWSGRGCPKTSCTFSVQENLYNWR